MSAETAAAILRRMPAERLVDVVRLMDEDKLIERLDRLFVVANLAVSPSEAQPHEEVTVTVSITNTSSDDALYPAVLRIDDAIEQTQTVEVGAGQTLPVVFTVTKAEGHYTVKLHGLSDRLTVAAPAAPTPVTATTPPTAESTASPTRTPTPTSTTTPFPTATLVPTTTPQPASVPSTSTVTPTSSSAASATATPATATPSATAHATAVPTPVPTGSPTPTPATTPIPSPGVEGEIGVPFFIILVLLGFAAVGLAVSLYFGQRE